MDTEPQRSDVPSRPADDSIGRRVLLTILLQIGIALLTIRLMAAAVSSRGSLIPIAFGVVQWAAALIPLCLSERRKGYSLSFKGILITGCIGFLLSAACSGLMLQS